VLEILLKIIFNAPFFAYILMLLMSKKVLSKTDLEK